MLEIPWYKKCLGYLYPIVLAKKQSDKHTNLKIKYYQGQIQLESDNALYSDGYRYSPFRTTFHRINTNKELEKNNTFLLLGAGLGSALYRLQKVYNIYPESYLVEYDADIIHLSRKYLLQGQTEKVHFILQEAHDYLKSCNQKFDLIGIDLFDNLENSYLLSQDDFWNKIKKISHQYSNIIVNTIFLDKEELKALENRLAKDFTFERINRPPNYFYILKLR